MSTLQEDLVRLRELKQEAAAASAAATEKSGEFKSFQAKTLDRAEAEKTTTIGTDGTLFSVTHKVKGNVTDRKAFVRWALEQDESIQEFLQFLIEEWRYNPGDPAPMVEQFYEAVMGTALVEYKPDGKELNRIATSHVDDDQPLPPGVGWYPDNYISQRAA